MLRERVLRTALLCCSPNPPSLYGIKTCNLGEYQIRAKRSCSFPATSARPATLHASTTVFSVYFHSPCGCFDAFIGNQGIVFFRLSPFNLMLKLTVNATLARKLDLRTGVLLDENKCLPDCAARCLSLH